MMIKLIDGADIATIYIHRLSNMIDLDNSNIPSLENRNEDVQPLQKRTKSLMGTPFTGSTGLSPAETKTSFILAIQAYLHEILSYPLVTPRFTGETEINVWGRGPVSHHGKKNHR
jgi:hypothetical protein